MGLFDRIILALYTFCLAFLSLGVIIIGLQVVPLDVFQRELFYLYGRWDFAFIGLVFFIVSLRLLFSGLSLRQRRAAGIVKAGKMGELRISFEAIHHMVQYVVYQIQGIQDIRTKVNNTPEGVLLHLELVISPGTNLSAITLEVQEKVKEYIETMVDIPVKEVQVSIGCVSNGRKKMEEKKRVK